MSLFSRMIVVLTSVGILSGGFLASVGLLTKKRIALNKQREIENAIFLVVPGTHSIQKLYEEKDLVLYGGIEEEGKILGYAIQASVVGFQDKITFMFGTNITITKINSLTIIEQKETPGLGAKITSHEFFLQYWKNKNCSGSLSLKRPAVSSADELSASEVNTITGATISSEAVLNSVNKSIEKLKTLKEGRKLNIKGENAS
ncbi:MAG: FMN-binding protein [Candidatus Aminicenantaceae bacterium]